jgi:hypothetical protein
MLSQNLGFQPEHLVENYHHPAAEFMWILT